MNYITMQNLGRCGRFGNQMFQYTFLKTYAKQWELQVQTPAWVGQAIYELTDPGISIRLPQRRERYNPQTHQPIPPKGREFTNTDFFGYAQYHTSYYKPNQAYIQQLFRVRKEYLEQLNPQVETIRGSAKTLVGLHIRRGDYGQHYFPRTPLKWFLQWLKQNWSRWDHPQLVLATEDPNLAEAFSNYNARLLPNHTTTKLPPYFCDFYLLTQCDVLAISESSFSFFAAMLNTKLQELWQSRLNKEGFEQIDPWDSYVLPREKISQYPHLQKLVTTDADRLDSDADVQN